VAQAVRESLEEPLPRKQLIPLRKTQAALEIIKHLHWVERECFSCRPTPIQLPSWVDPD